MNEWQPIETAPKDGTRVLLWWPDFKHEIWVGSYDITESYTHGKLTYRSARWTSASYVGNECTPTFWQPLPDDPPDV